VSHSGTAGTSTGDYVLNLGVQRDDQPPQVDAAAGPGPVLDAAPTELTVTFTEAVNLQQLAFEAYARTQHGGLDAVTVRGPDGTITFPRFLTFDPTTNQATLLLLDRLHPGNYALRLSGPDGLTDLAGNPLVGNQADGSYVLPFTVAEAHAGPPYVEQNPNGYADQTQDLGVLFPHELQGNGVTIGRGPREQPAPVPTDTGDTYRFQVLQAQNYFFLLAGYPVGTRLMLTDTQGKSVVSKTQADNVSLVAFLQPGTYRVRVDGWTAEASPRVSYTLRLVLGGAAENPQPLTLGPAPILRLQLAHPAAPPAPTPAGTSAPPSSSAPAVVPAPLPAPSGSPPRVSITDPAPPQAATTVAVPTTLPAPVATGTAARPDGGRLPSTSVDLLTALGTGPVGGVTRAAPAAAGGGVPFLSLGNVVRQGTSGAQRLAVLDGKPAVDGGGGQPPDGTAGVPAEWLALPQLLTTAGPVLLDLAGNAAAPLGTFYRWLEVLFPLVSSPAPRENAALIDEAPDTGPEAEPPAADRGPNDVTDATRPAAPALLGPVALLAGLGCVAAWSGARSARRGAGRAARPTAEDS
jgi:hypothetical protein